MTFSLIEKRIEVNGRDICSTGYWHKKIIIWQI